MDEEHEESVGHAITPHECSPDLRGPCVVIDGHMGNVFDGKLNIIGPFATVDTAVKWCQQQPLLLTFLIKLISSPDSNESVRASDIVDARCDADSKLMDVTRSLLNACVQALKLHGTDDEAAHGCGDPTEVAQDLRDAIAKATELCDKLKD